MERASTFSATTHLPPIPRLTAQPANPDPFFQRRQFGFALGGPIRRDRFFFFGTYERNEQRGVAATTLLVPEFVHLNRVTPSPFFNTQLSLRLDGRLSKAHTAFVRYSHDGIRACRAAEPSECVPVVLEATASLGRPEHPGPH